MQETIELENPFVWNDDNLFEAEETKAKIINLIKAGNNVAVVGTYGVGKTTLVCQVIDDLIAQGINSGLLYLPIFRDFREFKKAVNIDYHNHVLMIDEAITIAEEKFVDFSFKQLNQQMVVLVQVPLAEISSKFTDVDWQIVNLEPWDLDKTKRYVDEKLKQLPIKFSDHEIENIWNKANKSTNKLIAQSHFLFRDKRDEFKNASN